MSEPTKTCNRCGAGYELYESVPTREPTAEDKAPPPNTAKRTGSITLFVDNPIDPNARVELCPPCAKSFAEWRAAETATAKPKKGKRADG